MDWFKSYLARGRGTCTFGIDAAQARPTASYPLTERPSFTSTRHPTAQAFLTPTPFAWSASTFCKPGSLGENPSPVKSWQSLHVSFFVVLEALIAGSSDDQYGHVVCIAVIRKDCLFGHAVCVVQFELTQTAGNADDRGDTSCSGADTEDGQQGLRWLQAAQV